MRTTHLSDVLDKWIAAINNWPILLLESKSSLCQWLPLEVWWIGRQRSEEMKKESVGVRSQPDWGDVELLLVAIHAPASNLHLIGRTRRSTQPTDALSFQKCHWLLEISRLSKSIQVISTKVIERTKKSSPRNGSEVSRKSGGIHSGTVEREVEEGACNGGFRSGVFGSWWFPSARHLSNWTPSHIWWLDCLQCRLADLFSLIDTFYLAFQTLMAFVFLCLLVPSAALVRDLGCQGTVVLFVRTHAHTHTQFYLTSGCSPIVLIAPWGRNTQDCG